MLNQPRKYRLRWRFDYLGKPSKMGMWSLTSNNPVDQAWNKNTNVIRAKIEVKDLATREIKVLVSCPGVDFLNFGWLAVARGPVFFRNSVQPVHQLIGLQMWTREKKIAVFDTGKIQIVNLKPAEKQTNFATFGR